jgi:hypothetical protein
VALSVQREYQSVAKERAAEEAQRKEVEAALRREQKKSELVAQAAERAQKVAEAAIKMGQVRSLPSTAQRKRMHESRRRGL